MLRVCVYLLRVLFLCNLVCLVLCACACAPQTQGFRANASVSPPPPPSPVDRLRATPSLRLAQVANFYTSSRQPEYVGAVDAMRKVYASEGMAGFFKGARARVLVHTPSMAISWSTYELIKSALVSRTW